MSCVVSLVVIVTCIVVLPSRGGNQASDKGNDMLCDIRVITVKD